LTLASLPTNLKILRRVRGISIGLSSYLADEYSRRRLSIDPATNLRRSDVIDPATGWIDNDLPRDEWATTEIRETTVEYAIGDPIGRIVRGQGGEPLTFKTYKQAEAARSGAKVQFNVDVETPEEQVEDEETTLAFKPRRERDKPA
jgi:hypothetical protein